MDMLIQNHQLSVVAFSHKVTRQHFGERYRRAHQHDTYKHGKHLEGRATINRQRAIRQARRDRAVASQPLFF